MIKQDQRRLIAIGGSVGITFPKKFLNESTLKAGDQVTVVFDEILVIVKPELPKEVRNDTRP